MKIAVVEYQSSVQVGIVEESQVFLLPQDISSSIEAIIHKGDRFVENILERKSTYESVSLSQVRLKAPLQNPEKIIGIGLNYKDHCREQNVPVPEHPLVFAKFSSSIIGNGDAICWNTELTRQVDFEVELGVIIGKKARNVSTQEALEHVFGYTIINDVSARDLQFRDRQWVRAKSLDTFCPMGPWIVTADEIPDPQALHLSTELNGVKMQNSSTAEMVFSVAELISFLSQAFTLQPGDIIATGTPDGVGVFRKPPVFLQNGDSLRMEIEKIGVLENTCKIIR
ncbi:fumarylacetoacetate hydrolase family protein [Anaerolinea sp.]|uniref:fumarylacetoacetate hydrolase family protein n=1 Tax=Anaerolinea sp. TaxID=1872519 RepID=UPI002ACE959D|nr:fumarylacetoacetate hydrolase family protein [Anaerolinea sp.]